MPSSKRYKYLKKNGKCSRHPKEDVILNKTFCKKCVERKEYLKSIGKCANHPNNDVVQGTSKCKICLDRTNKWKRLWKSEGRCVNHPDRLAVKGKKFCQECLDYFKKVGKENKLKKINNGNCRDCGQVAVKGLHKCQLCLNKEHIRKKEYLNTERGREIIYNNGRKRRERENYVIHDYTVDEWINKKNETNGYCLEKYGGCGKYVGINKLTLDHFYSLNKAYKDYLRIGIKRVYTINDVNPICLSCNAHKHCV